jgi:hypothetical protein
MLYSDYQVHVMGHVPYVGFATRSRATAMTRFTFFKKKKKKKKKGRHREWEKNLIERKLHRFRSK